MVEVRVPATSANMGAGFDTMGIALDIYNFISVEEKESGLKIVNKNSKDFIPTNKNNLIYKSIIRVFDEVGYKEKGLEITQNSSIPVTRGLGSSSACIVGGLLAGNVLSGRKLPYDRILDLAAEMEGHPDNVAPALYGGYCVSVRDGKKVFSRSFKIPNEIRYAVMTPDFFVSTRKSRGLLPEKVSLEDAAHNISRAVWFATGLATGNLDNIQLGAEDRLHQPYRKNSVEGMEEIFEETYKWGSKATFLSGSGPTILSVLDGGFDEFEKSMNTFLKKYKQKWQCKIAKIDNVGSVVKTTDF